jgi:hypothetical protein
MMRDDDASKMIGYQGYDFDELMLKNFQRQEYRQMRQLMISVDNVRPSRLPKPVLFLMSLPMLLAASAIAFVLLATIVEVVYAVAIH